jgi:8-oxo-dGTP pyrophosphatase MutT (NUDIX family)
MIRETYEETGLNITPSDVRHIETYYAYVESNDSNLIYHEFSSPYND